MTCQFVLAVGAGLALAASCLAQNASENVTFHSSVSLAEMGGSLGADLWGYVSPSGREYALFCCSDRLTVVEVTDPDAPVVIGSIPHGDCAAVDAKVYKEYCYVVSCFGGMNIIDLTQVDDGIVTLAKNFTGGGFDHAHNIAINEETGFLYLAIGNVNSQLPVAYDLSDPVNPVVAGQMSFANGGRRQHDMQAYLYKDGPYAGKEILFGAAESGGFHVIDATDKTSMTLLSETFYPGLQYAHNCWIDKTGQYVFLGDELDDGFTPGTRTMIFDVSDLANPVYLGDFTNGVKATDHNLYVKGDFIYEANYASGLRVYDASDPTNPVEVAWYDTFPDYDDYGYVGAWTAYPFLPSGNIIVSDRKYGLFVLDVTVDDVCYADFNADGNVNILDFVAFQNAFTSSDPKADCDASGTLDILDFVCFQNVFQAGCP